MQKFKSCDFFQI